MASIVCYPRNKGFPGRTGVSGLLWLIILAPLAGFSQGSDLGFETPVVGYGSYQYNPGGAPWTFAGNSGLTGNASGFTASNPNAPEGSQVAFVQTTGSMSQPMTFAAASYKLVFSAAQRNYGSAWQTFNVTLDGLVLTNLAPAQGATTYQDFTVGPFQTTSGAHTLAFVGTDLNGGDNTIFIDNLRFTQMTLSAAISPGSFTTNHPFAVTITTWPTNATAYYRLNGGDWLTYTNPFTIGDGKNAATVQVDSYTTDGVSFSSTNSVTYVYQPPAVANDFFMDRMTLTPPPIVYPDTVNGTTFQHPGFWTNLNVTLTGASMENNEPNHANTSPAASVWYSYTTASSGEMRIAVPTNNASVIAIYTGGSDTYYFPFEGSAVNALNANFNFSINGAGATFIADAAPIPGSSPDGPPDTQSLNLNGTGSYAQLVDANLNSFTYSLWVKVRTVQPGAVIYRTSSAGPQSNCSEYVAIDSSGKWSAWGGSAITSSVPVQPNIWYHLALSGANNGAMHFYVNGVEQGTPISNTGNITSRDRWQMGQAVAGGGMAFDGEVDDLAIYHKALSASQITALATGTTPSTYAAWDISLLSAVASSTSGTLSVNALGNTVYQIALAAPRSAIYDFPADFYFFPPPVNDNFTNAAVIPNTLNTTNLAVGNGSVQAAYLNYSVQGYTEQATAEAGETENAKLSVWYSFLAPASGWLNVSAANASGIYSYLEIGQGTVNNFTNTTRSGWSVNPAVTLRVVGGQQYYIRHFSDSANNWTPFTLTLVHYPQPTNDLFANPSPLTLNSQTLHYVFNNGVAVDYPVLSSVTDLSDFAATRESVGEPSYGNSVWYNYTPSQNGRLVVGLADYGDWGAYNGYEMGLYTGTAANALTTQFNSQGYNWNALMNGWLTAGTNYLERIATYDSSRFLSVFEVTNTFFPNPANDNFTNRQPIVTRYVTNYMTWQGQQLLLSVDEVANVPGFNFSATTENGEPLQSGTYNSIWYSWTPIRNESVTINTVNSYQYLSLGTTINTYLAAYTGSAVNALTTVTGNDNGPGMGNWSQIKFSPSPGTEYEMQISNWGNGNAGWTMLNLQQPIRPANDYFTNATPLTLAKSLLGDGSTFEYLFMYGTITNASVETGEPNSGGISTVWYNWTNDITGPVTIRMDSSFGGNCYVYTGNAVSSLSTIASPVSGLDGKIYCTFNGVAGSVYRIQVRCGPGGGAFSLELSQKANAGNYVTTNDSQTNGFQFLPDTIDSNNRYVGLANGSATNATLEPGETNALSALFNAGAELNENYNTSVVGSNSLWWSYTATATRKMATYNQALAAYVPMRMGLGYDAFMNLVKPSNPFNENPNLVVTTNGTYFTNSTSATVFASRPAPGAAFRFEMDYMYVANAGAANGLPNTYNILVMGNNAYYDPLVIRTTDLRLGAYNNGNFTPYNIALTANQEYYLSLECNGGGAATAYTLTVNRTNSSTIYAGFDANTYYPTGLGACGGRIHDLRVYQTSPVSHEAIEVWQDGNLIAIDDDVVVNNCTAGVTYQIRTTPLSCTSDVATGKIATESSVVNPATNAVDNNNSTYSSTGNDTGAWLMVDLGQSYPIDSVEIWNRFDQPSAANFNVILADTNSSNPAILTNYAINCGGGAVGWFGADAYVSGGSTWNSGNAIDTSAVTNPAPASAYQSQRYGNFTYTIPNLLTNGSYIVRLHFAECYFTSPNQRQENVFINGMQVLTNFDAFAAAGAGNKANIQSFTITPNSSGQITIQFVTLVQNAAVEGIEVIPTSDTVAAFQASQATNGLYYYPYQGSAQWPTTIPIGRSGRYIRVQQNTAGTSLGLSSLKVNSTPTINGQVNVSVSEFNLSADGNSPEAAKLLSFSNQVSTWVLPNGTVSSTNYVAADSQEVAYATFYSGEWNPGGVSGGSVWYNFVPPVSGSTIIASSGAVGEYLALYPGPNTSGYITYGWGPFQLNLNGGTPYWLQVGLASYGLEGVNLTIVGPPPNDNWSNAINVNFATNLLTTSSPDGLVTNYTFTSSFVGQNYLATRDAGEYDIANYTGVGTKGRSVWWTITAPANGYITIDPSKSSFITELGFKPESLGVGGGYGGYWVVNNGKIVNAYLTAGTRYKLCVDGSSQDTGQGMGGINLDVTFVPCPPNDNWANPTPVTLQTNVLTGTVPDGATLYTNYTGSVASHNIGATYEGGEYVINNYSSQGAPGRSVWFSFTAPASGYLKIDPTKSTFRAQIGIKAPGQLVGSGWGNPNAYAVNSALTYYVNAGSSYMICVDGTSSDAGYGIINLDFKLDASPGNDNWAKPTSITFQANIAPISLPNGTATNTYYTAYGIGNNIAATYESGEYVINNYSSQGAPGRSIWFTFTAPYTGTLTVDPTKSTFRAQIGIKAPGQAVSSGWGSPNAYAVNSILSYGVTAGNTYMICVDGTSSDAGYGFVDLALQISAIPYNDVFPGPMLSFATNAVLENVAEFTVTNFLYTATAVSANNYALQDSGEYSLCSQYSAPCLGRTIWWSFIPPVQSYATISLAGSTFDTLMAGGVFNSVNNAKSWYNDDANGLVTSAATFLVYPGQTNRIVVDGKSGASAGSVGGVNLTVNLGASANDFYANAQVLTAQSSFNAGNMSGVSIRVPGSTTYASNEGENWSNWLPVPPNKNVWFSYTATNSGIIYLTVESAANHLIAVYSGSSFNSGWIGGSIGILGASPNAAFTFNATAGTTYKISIDGTVPGPFVLNLKHYNTTAPANDAFGNRISLTNGVTTTATLAGSTRESGEPSYHGGNGSVWYSFVAACSGQLEVDTRGGAADTVIAAYTTNSVPGQVNNLTYLAANTHADGNASSRISFPVTAGREYEIAVALNSGTLQDFAITPRLTCAGYVEADPGAGNFLEYATVFLTTPGSGSIYYSLNGGAYRIYTNGPGITPTNLVYVGVTNGIFFKIGGGNNWNGGFTSIETITGDGFAECVATANNQDSMFGLQTTYSSPSYTGIDYALYLWGSGQLQIYEAGTFKATVGYYNIGDRIRVVRTGNIVRYYRNGGLIYTSSLTSTGALHFAASMYQQGNTMGPCYLRDAGTTNETGIVISSGDVNGNATLSAYSQAGSVSSWNYTVQAAPPVVLKGNYLTWTNLSGVYQAGSLLTKYSANNAWGNALAVSAESSSADCSADFVVSAGSSYNMAGLTTNNAISSYGDISFAWYNANNTLYIYENGNSRGSFGLTGPGDVLRIERLGSTINYYQNGNLRYTSSFSSSGTLRAATTIYWTATQLGPASFYLAQSPALTIAPNTYGDSTLYTTAAPPASAPTVTSSSPDAFAQPPSLSSSANFRFKNFRTGSVPSTDVVLSYSANSLPGLIFQVPGSVIYTTNPITVVSPSGVGGTWTITFPNGSKASGTGGGRYTFNPQGGGIYTASLFAPGYNIPSASTNLSFVVNDLGITPSGTYGTIPFYVNAWGAYPLSIYYTFAAQGTPNILYTNSILLGNTNVTIRFMGTRPGFTPQYLIGTYAYSPNVTIFPTGTFSNATTFTVSGGDSLQYQAGNGPWQNYTGPFTLDGIPGGSDFLRGTAQVSPGIYGPTNSSLVTFQAASPVLTPPSGAVNGNYTVTAQSDSVGAGIYYAMGDSMGSMPAPGSATNLYNGPISLSGSRNFVFTARKANYLDSAPVTNTYVAQLPAPAFVTPGATFSGPTQIDVQSGDGYGGTFVLTSPSGAVQTVNTTNRTASFIINEGGQFTLLLQRNGWTPSPSVTQSYDFEFTDLSIAPAVSCIYAPTIVSINWDGTNPKTPTVYYTLDGSSPTSNSTRYTGAFTVTNSATVIALGIRAGYGSALVTNSYTYESPVTAWPPSGTYNNAISLSLSNGQALAIYYQVNGGGWQTYTGPFSLDGMGSGNVAISTRYDTAALCPGPTNLNSYAFKTADPIVTPTSTNFGGSLTISASDDTAGAAIFYAAGDTNGNQAFASAITNLYPGPIAITSTRQFIFQARKSGYQDSAQMPLVYSSPLPSPAFGTPGGIFTNATAITLNSPLNTSQSFVLTFPGGNSQTNSVTGTSTAITINETGTYLLQLFKTPWLPSAVTTTNYAFQVADLQVAPPSQLFSDPFQVTASQNSNPKPMTIYYADDGSVPTTNAFVYSSPITVSNTITLRFMGWRQGYTPQYIDRTYTYAPGLAISPPSGTNSSGITVTMTPYRTNSAIYYSINDGVWTTYAAPFGIDGASNGVAVIKAYAVTGPLISPTNIITYTFKVAGLTVNPASQSLNGNISVTAGTTTPGADIYYANGNDGGETPPVAAITNLYTGSISVSSTKALIFEGRKAGYLPSDQLTHIYSATLPTPRFVTPPGTFANQTAITVKSGLPGYGATFTLLTPSGSVLTFSSGTDTATFNINETGNYQLSATKANWLPSDSTNQSFNFVVADLKVSPASGTFGSSNLVVTAQSTISNPKPLKIYYTTDENTPTTNSTVYVGGITITNSTTFKWLATRDYYAPQYATNAYTWVPGITLSPPAGTFSNATTFTLSTLAPGAQLFYSTNATDWHAYTAPIVMDGFNTGIGTLRATYTNASSSGPTNSFTINFVAAPPQVSPDNQTVYSNLTVTAVTPTAGARIYYSLSSSGFDPVNLSNLYTSALTITNRSFLTFQAGKDGYQNSASVQRKYIQKLPAPTQLTTGDFTNWVSAFVELPQPISGVSIVVTHPALTNETRGAPISPSTGKPLGYYIANATGPYVVKAVAADWEDSDAITNALGFYVRDLETPDDQKFNTPVFEVSAGSSLFPINPKPLTIYYTTDGSDPSTSSILYTGPVPITTSTMFRWLATRDGYYPQTRTNTYTYVPPLSVTPPPGIYSNAITVALTSPNDEPIFFSLNGGPWQSYASPMTFDGYVGGYLSLQAIYTGGATNNFSYTFQADPPVVTPESQILDSGPVTLSVANGNTIGAAVVYFEGDAGGGVASTNRPMVAYTDPITVPASRSYLFQARKNNYLPSALVGRTFTSQLPAPTVLTSAGTFTAPVQVQVQSGLPGYGGTYLMINPDGTTNKVTTEAPLVTFQVNASGTYQFQMQRAGWLDSAATMWNAVFNVADLTVTPAGGLISVPNTPVTAKGGINPKPLKIYYSLDGIVPTTNSAIYSQPILINDDATIIWLATRDGYNPMLQTNMYVFVAGVSISPAAIFYTNATSFTLTPLGPSDGIFYRTNAGDWMAYAQPFTLDGTTDLSFYSRLGGKFSITNKYTATFKVGEITVLPNNAVFTNTFNISANDGTTNATIVYRRGDEDASPPPRSLDWVTNIYTGPIPQATDNSSRYLFSATKPGYTSADWVERIYTAKMPVPTSLLGTNLQIAAPTQNTLTMFRPCRVRSWTNTFATGQYLNNSEQPFVNVTYIHPGTYWYRASRHGWADSDDLPVVVRLRQPDNFADRIDLSLLWLGTNYNNGQAPQTYGALGDITGATREADEWDGTFDDNGLITTDPARVTSLWYRWVSPTNGLAQIKVFNNYTGDKNDLIYGVYTGNSLASLGPILMAHQPAEFMAVAGTEYSIAVNSGLTPGQAGEFQVQIDFYATPLNDFLSNALPIIAGQVYSGYTHAATNEPGEISGNSTWWQFRTLQGGTLEVPLTTGVEATLWQGDSPANINEIPAQYHTATDYHFPEITTNNYFFVLPTSGAYKLRVAGAKTIYSFAPKFHLAPPHDNFPATIRLPAGVQEQQDNHLQSAVTYDSTTLGATLQPSEPSTAWPTTVWYQWTAPDSGDLDISVGQLYLFSTPGFGTTLVSWQSRPVDFLTIQAFTGNNFSDLAELPHVDNKDSFSSFTLMPNFETEDPATNATVAGALIADTYTALFTGNVAYTTYREGWWRWRAQFNGDAYLTKLLYPSFAIDVFTGDRYEDLLPQPLSSAYAGDSSIAPQSYFHATMDQVYTFHVQFGNRPATNDNYSFKVEPETLSRAYVTKGQLVYFRVAGLGSPHRIKLNLTSRASNDDFKDAMNIPLQAVTYENGRKALGSTKGSLVGATAESFESNDVHSVWYKITAPIAGHGRARLTGNYSTFVNVYSGTDPTNLVSLNPEDFPVTPDTQYFIRVWDLSIQNYILDITLSEQPANDMLANALPLQRSSFKAYTDHATVESGEPIKQQSIGESVWWRYAPSLDGTIVVGSQEKTAYLWQGSNLLQLVQLANNLGGDIITPLAKNQEYRISFDTTPGKLDGDFNAVAAYYVLPANDDFVNAIEITSRQNTVFTNGILYTYSQRGYTYGATSQLNEPPAHEKSVWYSWTAPTNLIVYVACGLPVYVYSGDNVSALNAIGEKVFSAVAGQTYRIAVCGGPSEFTLTLNGALPPYNDNHNSAIALSGANPVSFYTYASSVESYDQPTTNGYSVWWTWTSGNSTNLFVYPDSKRGPDDPVQDQYPRFFASEIRVIESSPDGPPGKIVGQGYVSFDDPYVSEWQKFVLSVPIRPATDYRIVILSPYPTRGLLRVSEKPLPIGCPLGSECNPATPVWGKEDNYVNGTIYRGYLLAYGGSAPDPYWFFTKFPWFYVGQDVYGNAVLDPQGWLTSSYTNITFRFDGVDTPCSDYMPVVAGNDADTVRIVTGGVNTGVTFRDVHVPLNDTRELAIVPPLNVDATPSYSFTTYDSASRRTMWRTYNNMAATEEDGYAGSVWYILRIPAAGRLFIENQTASMLQLIPVNASLDEMVDTNIGVYDYHAELLPNGPVTYPAMTEPVINFRGKTPVNGSNFPYTEELSWVSPFTGKAIVTVNQSNVTVSASSTVAQSSQTSQTIEFQAERGRRYAFTIHANYNTGGSSFQLKPEIPTVVPAAPLGQPITFGPYGSSTGSREVVVNPGYYYVVQFGDWSAGGIEADFYANVSNDNFANAAPLADWQLTRYGNGRIYNLGYRYKLGSATLEPGEPPPAVGDRTLWYSFIAPMSGQLQFQGWANIYSGTSLSNLTLLSRNDGYSRQPFFVTAGNLYYIQTSGSFGGNNTETYNAITIIEPPSNDYFNTAVPIVTNYNTITNIAGTNYYLYEFTAPAGFWPAVQDDQGRTFYIRNWYRIESDDLADIWVYGWNSTLDGAVVTPGNHAYADVNMDAPVTLPNNDPYAPTVVVTPEARSEIFPTVWGKNAYDIQVPWTWNYAAHQQLATVTTNGSSIYDIAYTSINDQRYKGLFDLSVFSIGEKLSYLYAVPGNLVVKAGGQDLRMKYVFVLRKPTSVKLTPVFPVGRQTAAESVEVKAQRFQLNTNVYTYLSTLEGGEPNKPGTGGGSVWWTLDAPYTGFLRVNANSIYDGYNWSPTPLIYIWEGPTLSTLNVLASNYTTASALGREVIAAVVAGQKLWVSADRQDDGGVFNFTATMEPRPLNQDADHATELVAKQTSFENGTNWAYNTAFTIYPVTGDYTNNDLWFKLTAPAAARLSADTNASLLTLYATLKHDLRITPPSRDYLGSLTLAIDTDDPAVIYYTLDGSTPSPSALPYTGSFVITNTATVRAVAFRTNRSEVYAAENYIYHAPLEYPPPAQTNSGPYLLDLSNPDNDGASIIFRVEGGDWQTYTGPTNLDGLGDFGEGYVYFTRVLNGRTNPIQYVHLNFQLPTPQLDITNAVIPYTNSSLTVSITNVPPGAAAVWMDNGADQSLIPDATDPNIWRLTIPISQANSYQFRLTKRGYQPSPIAVGTYTAEPIPPPSLPPLPTVSGGTQASASFTITGFTSDSVLQVRYTQYLKSAPPLSAGSLLSAATASYSTQPGEEYLLSNPAWYVSADGAFNGDLFNQTWDSSRVDTLSPSNGEVNVTMPWGSQAQLVLIRTVWGRTAESDPVTVPITWKMPQPQYTAVTNLPASWNGTNYTQFYYELQPPLRIGAIHVTYNSPVSLPQPDDAFAPTLYTRIYGVYLDNRGGTNLFYATDPYHDHVGQTSDASPFASYVQATTPSDYGRWAFWTDRYAIAVNAPNNRPPGPSPLWNDMSNIANVMSLFDGWVSHGLNRILADYLYPDSVPARVKPLIHINGSGNATIVQVPVYVNLPGGFTPANIEPSDPVVIQSP